MMPVRSVPAEKQHRSLLIVALGLGLIHVVLTWGYIGKFWLDSGRWLHEVDRFAHGEVLYREYVWPFPPMAMWLLGGVARLFGGSLKTIWTATSIVFLLLVVLYSFYVRKLVEPSLRMLVLLAGLLLATAHANWVSAPLPMGMYTPAAPIGFLFLFAALLCVLGTLNSERAEVSPKIAAGCAGLLCGLAVLTKQDFWVPALLLAAYAGWVLGFGPRSSDRVGAASVWALFVITVVAGVVIVGTTAGWSRWGDIVNGFGRVAEFRGRQFPSWERITIELAGTALIGLLGTASLVWGGSLSRRGGGKWLGWFGVVFMAGSLLHVWMSFQIGSLASFGAPEAPSDTLVHMRGYTGSAATLLRGAVAWLHVRLENNLFSVFLPAGMLIAILTFGRRIQEAATRRTLLFLVLVCLAARARRGFEHVEWFHLLLEIPVYLAGASAILAAYGRPSRRALQAFLGALLLLGCYFQMRWGKDSLLSRKEYERVDTPRGTVYLLPRHAEQYRLLQQALTRLDPTGARPLLAFGYSGGHNYFLDRPNPTPLEEGFQTSGFPPEQVLDQLRSSRPSAVLLDTNYYRDIRMPSPRLSLAHWELPTMVNAHMRVDRALFERALQGCHKFEAIHPKSGLEFVLYDCAPNGS